MLPLKLVAKMASKRLGVQLQFFTLLPLFVTPIPLRSFSPCTDRNRFAFTVILMRKPEKRKKNAL